MAERDDEQLEALLRQFLSDELDGQLGRSERHFRRYLAALSAAAWRQRAWLIGAFVSGLAASVAFLWAAPMFHTTDPGARTHIAGTDTNRGEMNSNLILPAMERVVQSKTMDEGVILLPDNTPARILHRRALEKTRWFDGQDKVREERITPKDDFVLIKLSTY